MHIYRKFYASLIVLLLAWSSSIHAEGYAALTYGYDQNGFRSYAFNGDAEFLQDYLINLDHLYAETSGVVNMQQTGLGLTGYVTELLSGHYRYSESNDTVFFVRGNEGDLSLALNTLWDSDFSTKITAGYGSFVYGSARPPVSGNGRTFTQTRRSFRLSQDVLPSLTLYASYDQYEYDVDIVKLAAFLALRTRVSAISAFSFLSFPETSRLLGFSWMATDKLSFDLSSGKTITMFDQEITNSRFGADYQLGKKLNVGVAITRNLSSELVRNTGVVVQTATDTTFNEITAGLAF